MRTPMDEQETIITWYRDEDIAKIYTSDYTMMNKYDKKVSSGDWKLLNEEKIDGDVVSKIYSAPKELVYGRTKKKKQMSDEQKEKQSEIFKSWRENNL